MPTLLCNNSVRTLLRSAINYPNRQVLVEYVHSQDTIPRWDLFLLTMPEIRRKYWQALVALHIELVPNHIGPQDLYSILWELFKEITLNASQYQTRANLDHKLFEFGEIAKKRLQVFYAIYWIENLDIGDSIFNLGNVSVLKLTSDCLDQMGLKTGVSAGQDRIIRKWVGRFVAETEVSASEISRAYESGLSVVNSVIDTIRLLAVRKNLSNPDEMFLWELGESIAIPKNVPNNGMLVSTRLHRGFSPIIVPVDNSISEGLEEQETWRYMLDGNLPEDIATRIFKAIKWISHAVTSSSLDYKLVDLCTALEILLLPEHKKGTKGELIALRQVLIGHGTSYVPETILYLYEKRSNIIHSGALEITSHSDYWHLRICCLQVLSNIVNLSKRDPSIDTLKDLLKLVENGETLQEFIVRCDRGIYDGEGINRIKKAAQTQLSRL